MKFPDTIVKLACAVCLVLIDEVTSDDDKYGHTFAAVTCAICGAIGLKISYDHLYILGKSHGKAVNQLVKEGKKTLKKFAFLIKKCYSKN